MTSNAAYLAMLAVFSGLSVNLILQLGLGIKRIALAGNNLKKKNFIDLGIFFITVIVLWLIFTFFRNVIFFGFLEYILVFPVSLFVFCILEISANKLFFKEKLNTEEIIFFGGTLSGAALFITLNIAGTFLEAVILSAGYACGIALTMVIINEIRLRSEMEAVPKCLRGSPLVLISLGLLSLAFSSAAMMLYQVLGAK